MSSLKSYPSTVDLKVFHEVKQSFCSSYLPKCKQIHPTFPSLSVLPMTVFSAGYSAEFLMFSLTKCDLPAGINGKHTGTLGFVPTHISGLIIFFLIWEENLMRPWHHKGCTVWQSSSKQSFYRKTDEITWCGRKRIPWSRDVLHNRESCEAKAQETWRTVVTDEEWLLKKNVPFPQVFMGNTCSQASEKS